MTCTRMVIAAIWCLSVLALGACSGDDPEPNVTPTPSTSPSPSTSTTPSGSSEPTDPGAGMSLTQSGAEHFVHYWFEALSLAMTTGDIATLRAASAPDCASCNALARQIHSLYENGGSVETDGWLVGASSLVGAFDPDDTVFLMRVDQTARVLRNAEGNVVDRTPPNKVPMRVGLSSASGHWVMMKLEILA